MDPRKRQPFPIKHLVLSFAYFQSEVWARAWATMAFIWICVGGSKVGNNRHMLLLAIMLLLPSGSKRRERRESEGQLLRL